MLTSRANDVAVRRLSLGYDDLAIQTSGRDESGPAPAERLKHDAAGRRDEA